MRRCTKCGDLLPATLTFFYRCRKTRLGLLARCKPCHLVQTRAIARKAYAEGRTWGQRPETRALYLAYQREYGPAYRKKNQLKIVQDSTLYRARQSLERSRQNAEALYA